MQEIYCFIRLCYIAKNYTIYNSPFLWKLLCLVVCYIPISTWYLEPMPTRDMSYTRLQLGRKNPITNCIKQWETEWHSGRHHPLHDVGRAWEPFPLLKCLSSTFNIASVVISLTCEAAEWNNRLVMWIYCSYRQTTLFD